MSTSSVTPSPAAPSSLAQLEAAVKALLGSGPTPTIDLSHLSTQFPGLAPILQRLPGAPSSITNATLVLDETAKTLTLAGTLTLLDAPFAISAVCSLVGSKPQLVLTGTQGTTALTLLALAEHLGHHASTTPDVSLTGLALTLGTDKGDFSLNGTANWTIPFGNTPSLTATAQVAFTSSTALITGTFVAASQTFTISCNLAKNADTLIATWTNHTNPLTWKSLVEAAGVPAHDLPSNFTGPAFTALELILGFSDRSLTFLAETSTGVDAFMLIKNVRPGWGFAIGVDQAKSFTLAQVDHNLKPLDFLTLSDAYLLFSTYDDPQFVPPTDITKANCPPPVPAFHVYPGLNFGAELSVTGGSGLSRTLHTLTGDQAGLSISGALNFPDNVIVSAALGKTLVIPRSNLQLTVPTLNVSLAGPVLDASIAATLTVPMGTGQQPLVVTSTFDMNDAGATFTANAAADYKINAPFGLHGLVLQDAGVTLGLAFDPEPGFSLALEVAFALGGSLQPGEKLAFELAITPAPPWIEPIYFYGKASQPITLPLLVNTVVPSVTLPALFNEFQLTNLLLSFADTVGLKLPDGTPVPVGYSFAGAISVFSFNLAAALNVTYAGGGPKAATGTSGVSGSFQMSPLTLPETLVAAAEHIGTLSSSAMQRDLSHAGAVVNHLPTLLSITGVTTPGPYFSFNTASLTGGSVATQILNSSSTATASAPLVSGQAQVTILGAVSTSIFLNLDSRGLTFLFGLHVGSSQATVRCTFHDKTLTASCTLIFNINESFDLHVPGTHEYVGKISINADFTGSLGVHVDTSSASLTVAGHFDGHTLPGGTFTVDSAALKDAAATIIQRIRSEAEEVFKDITGDVNKWAGLVKSGVVTGADSALHDASSAYGKAYKGLVQTEQQAQAAAAQAAKAAQDAADKAKQAAQDAANKAAKAAQEAAEKAKQEGGEVVGKVGGFFKKL